MIKAIFLGSPSFVLPVLKILSETKEVKLAGVISPSPETSVAKVAKKMSLPISCPEKAKELIPLFEKEKIDLAIVAAYGKIIPKSLLEIPRHGFLNLHPSLLPKYRGPTPGQAAILTGDKVSGVTLMKLDEGMDTGPILANFELRIKSNETAESFYKEAFEEGAKLLKETLPKYLNGEITPIPQIPQKATYTKLLTREDGRIDWSQPAKEIERMIRAYHPWPGAWTTVGEITTQFSPETPHSPNPLRVKVLRAKLRDGRLGLEQVQIEGKKPIDWEEFRRGYL